MRRAFATFLLLAASSCGHPCPEGPLQIQPDPTTLSPGFTSFVVATLLSEHPVLPGPNGVAQSEGGLTVELTSGERVLRSGESLALHDVQTVDSRHFRFIVDLPADFPEQDVALAFSVAKSGADAQCGSITGTGTFTVTPAPGLTRSPDGTGFCCPLDPPSCDGFRFGGWTKTKDVNTCPRLSDAAPPYTESVESHGCKIRGSEKSCL